MWCAAHVISCANGFNFDDLFRHRLGFGLQIQVRFQLGDLLGACQEPPLEMDRRTVTILMATAFRLSALCVLVTSSFVATALVLMLRMTIAVASLFLVMPSVSAAVTAALGVMASALATHVVHLVSLLNGPHTRR